MSGRLPKFEEMQGFKEVQRDTLQGKFEDVFIFIVEFLHLVHSVSIAVIEVLLQVLLPLVALAVFCFSCYDLISSNNMDIKCLDLCISAVMFMLLQEMYKEGGNVNVISRRRG